MWQVLYEELRDQNFEIIAVALDTGGKAAVEAHIRPTDLAQRADGIRRTMGWGESEWSRIAPPEYPCLIDEEHLVADLYGMTNVPMAVWIDEEGRLVRPTEAAGFSDYILRADRQTRTLADEDAEMLQANRRIYVAAIRDWVEKGPSSQYALSPAEVRRRMRHPSEDDVRAASHVRMGRHLYREGHVEAAKHHFQEAVRLCPDKWSYRRQSMVLDPELVGQPNVSAEYFEAREALGDKHYYPPIDMPGIAVPPPA